jgi:hypothetical protein
LPAATPPGGRRNGFATAALILGAAGASLVTIAPAVILGVLGLRRARRLRAAGGRPAGRWRCWLGIAFSVLWAATGGYLLPPLLLASDPGCAAYKGPALAAYRRVVLDLNGQRAAPVIPDLSRAISALSSAAARSHRPTAAGDLARLAGQLRAVLTDIQAGRVVPSSVLPALNADAARADAACGTLRLHL